jgi:hypothetical protein
MDGVPSLIHADPQTPPVALWSVPTPPVLHSLGTGDNEMDDRYQLRHVINQFKSRVDDLKKNPQKNNITLKTPLKSDFLCGFLNSSFV